MIKWFKEKNVLLRAISVILSICLWLYIVGVENPENDIDVRNISLIVTGEDALTDRSLVVTDGLDTTINLRVRGRRSDLVKIEKNENLKAIIDVSDIKAEGTYNHVYDVTLPSGITILDKSPYSVSLTVDDLTTENIEIKVSLEGSIAQGYIAKTPVANPSTIKVIGPKDLISGISYAQVTLKRDDISSNIEKVSLPFTLINRDGKAVVSDQVSTDITKVSVSMDVLKTKTVPLSVLFTEGGGATQGNIEYKLNPENIQIAGDPDIIDGLNQIVLGSVDLAGVTGSLTKDFKILLPNNVENLSGETSATLDLSVKGLKTQSIEADNIEIMHVPEGYNAELITQSLPVLIRGPEESVSQVKPFNLRVVVDLQGLNLSAGLHTVNAKVYIDGFTDVGVISQDYGVAIKINKS